MRNQYLIRNGVGVIFVDAPPNAGYGYMEVLVDVEDLAVAKSWPGSWYGFVHKSSGLINIRATAVRQNVEGFEQKQPLLHRVISKPDKGYNVAFKDGDPLNLTRANLVNLRIGEKYVAPEPIDPLKLDVVRGVHWRPEKQRFEVRVFHKGKGYYLGVWPKEKWQEANKAATDFRELGPDAFYEKYGKNKGK